MIQGNFFQILFCILILLIFVLDNLISISYLKKYFLSFIFSLFFLYFIYSNNFHSKWWIIDDHEIFYFLGSYIKYHSSSNFFEILLNQTEIGNFGSYHRYRISYYFLKLCEVVIWRDNPFLWYFFRFFIILFFNFVLLKFISKKIGITSAFVFVLYFLSFEYWSDIFNRLGPAEIYCVFGITLILIPFQNFNFRQKFKLADHLLVSLGIIIAAGSKENFIIFSVISIFFIYSILKYKKNIYFILFHLLTLIFVFITISSLYIFYSNNSPDIYGSSSRFLDRFNLITSFIQTEYFYIPLILTVILFSLKIYSKRIGRIRNISNQYFLYFFLFSILGFNYIFYNGVWPTISRYDFPGILSYYILCLFLSYDIIIRIYSILNFNLKISLIYFNLFIMILFIIFFPTTRINNLKQSSIENTKRTNIFSNFLEKFIKVKSKEIIIYSIHQGFDIEPLVSFQRFRHYYSDNRVSLLVTNDFNNENAFKNQLFNHLVDVGKNGSESYEIQSFDFKKIKGQDCIILYFNPNNIGQNMTKLEECKSIKFQIVPFY
jgi:hypothetical protein